MGACRVVGCAARGACAPFHTGTVRSADIGTCLTTRHWEVVRAAARLNGRQRRGCRGQGSGTVAVAGEGAGGPHAGSAMDGAGATNSHDGGDGDGARGVALGTISRSG